MTGNVCSLEKGGNFRIFVKKKFKLKGGCAHFGMCNFYSKLIDLDPQDTFFTILPQADFLFSLLVQKQVCDTGDEAVMKIHKNINIGK